MSRARIMRWKGGYGGDMVLYVMHASGIPVANVNFADGIDPQGRTLVHIPKPHEITREIEKLALHQDNMHTVDRVKLADEIANLGPTWLKSHCYDTFFDDQTVDIQADAAGLPFVIASNIAKTDTLARKSFHQLADKIGDEMILEKLALYNLARDSMNTTTQSPQKILVSQVISGWSVLCAAMTDIGVQLAASGAPFYHAWLQNNGRYLPSRRYLEMIAVQNFDWASQEITLAERYSALVLAGERFRVLD